MWKRTSVTMVPASSAQVHPRSGFSQAPWSTILRKAELKRHDSREARNFRRRFCIPYKFFLELVKLAKQVVDIMSLAATGVAGRQSIPLELKISRSCCQICQKRDEMYGFGSRWQMAPRRDSIGRTVLYYR